MNGPVQWISRGGWRKLEPFEVHAMWIFWRELSVRMGCKWVPYHLEELEHFREVRPAIFVKIRDSHRVTDCEPAISRTRAKAKHMEHSDE